MVSKDTPKVEDKSKDNTNTKKCSFCEATRQMIKNIFWLPKNTKVNYNG